MNLSPLASLAGWTLTGALTLFLFCVGLIILLPLSLIFERGSGGLLHGLSQFWARLIARLLPLWEIQAHGMDRIQKGRPYVIVSNHQSMLDILVVLTQLPLHFKFIAKRELFWIPFLGWHLALARYIPLKRGDPESGRACLERGRYWLGRRVSVLFFPEGTRSPDGQIHEFKIGAFKLAVEEKADLLPLVITGTRQAIPKHSWLVLRKSTLALYIQDPIPCRDFNESQVAELRDLVRERIVREFKRLQTASFS